MNEVVEVVQNFGISIACVAYMIYFQNTTMKEMLKTLSSINERLTVIEEKIEKKEV